MTTAKSLAARWEATVAEALNARLRAVNLRKATLTRAELEALVPYPPTSKQRADLRGFPFVAGVQKVNWTAVDMSFSTFSTGEVRGVLSAATIGPTDTQFTECQFDHIKIDSNIGGDLEGCSFRTAKMARSTFRAHSRFTGCSFEDASLRGIAGNMLRVQRCSFANCDLRGASMHHCVFEDCDFTGAKFGSGSLGGSKFDRCVITAVQLKDTILDGVSGLP